ncbi:MAG: response regulator [Elusimicrobia bacterium]|nr:response regulator [Elusimicrobiota bacterium]
MTITKPRVFTTFEVARICAVFHTTVINWANKGRIKVHHTPGGHRRIKVADLVDFMQRHDMPIPADLVGRPKRVMVVEDDASFQRMLLRTLQALPGVSLQPCTGGLDALIEIGKEAPDLVILDIGIPQVSGVEVCRVLKANEHTQQIKVIAVTGQGLADEAEAFLRENADGFFRKPLSPAKLRALAAELLDLEEAAAAAGL